MTAISYLDISKHFHPSSFKEKKALESVELHIPLGKITGLLGANGSGKSTLFKLTMGFIFPTQGEIRILGNLLSTQSKKDIGYVPENPRFQKFLTAEETLSYLGKLYGVSPKNLPEKIERHLKLVGLSEANHEKVGGFSKGMVQRLAIAQALIAEPKILILDEPMSGLDPRGRQEIKQLLLKVKEQSPDITIFFSSHVLNDVSEIADAFFVLKKGEVVASGSFEEFQTKFTNKFEIKFRRGVELQTKRVTDLGQLIDALKSFEHDQESLVSIQTTKENWDDYYSPLGIEASG